MLNQVWCLVVITDKPQALPSGKWMPQNKTEEIFGFKMAYFNPCDNSPQRTNINRPQIVSKECIGFYPVLEPFPLRPECKISAQDILTLALFPMPPRYALEEYQGQEYNKFISLAYRCYNLNQEVQNSAALAIAV